MLLGLRSAFYGAPDIATARDWYARVLGVPPYFDQPFYVGFAVGGFELGLVPGGPPASGATWGVDDVAATLDQLVALGATVSEAARDVGDGIIVGAVKDPFGNELGLIHNPHFRPADVR